MANSPSNDINRLLRLHPSSQQLTDYIFTLSASISLQKPVDPEVQSYSDAVYFNYQPLGLSLLFKPVNGYSPQSGSKRNELRDGDLVVDGIDIYNASKLKAGSKAKADYATFPIMPLVLKLSAQPPTKDVKPRPEQFEAKPETTGKDFVLTLGEPDRKGGGAGPSSGSIGIWCEWSKDGLMVEFGGDESRGPQAWERGRDATWKVISIFPPKPS